MRFSYRPSELSEHACLNTYSSVHYRHFNSMTMTVSDK